MDAGGLYGAWEAALQTLNPVQSALQGINPWRKANAISQARELNQGKDALLQQHFEAVVGMLHEAEEQRELLTTEFYKVRYAQLGTLWRTASAIKRRWRIERDDAFAGDSRQTGSGQRGTEGADRGCHLGRDRRCRG